MLQSICVYCASRRSDNSAHAAAATELGRLLADRGMTLVYGGGHVGLMGVLADAALAAGGRVIGVIPEQLQQQEVAHDNLTELHVVADMHQRKAMMATLADGYIALPGGLGTLEELFEVLTWQQLGIHDKPVGLINTGGYYDGLLGFLDQCAAANYIKAVDRRRLWVGDTPTDLLNRLVPERDHQ